MDFNLAKLSNSTYYILGDMNINISNDVQTTLKSDYLNMLTANNTRQLITKFTRVADNSKSLIDHILTNDSLNHIIPEVTLNDISDHFPIFCSFSKNISHKSTPIYYRDFNKFNSENYATDLDKNLSSFLLKLTFLTHENYNDIFDQFVSIIKSTIDKHAPLRRLSRKMKKLKQKQWITKGIWTSIRNKQKLYVTHYLNGSNVQKKYYKKYANKLTKLKSISKKKFYENEFTKFRSNSTETWKIIKSLLPQTKFKLQQPRKIQANDKVLSTSSEIATEFNKYFSNIGKKLAKKFSNIDINATHFNKYLFNSVTSSLFFEPTWPSEILNTIQTLSNSHAKGFDNISSYFLKVAAVSLANPLTILFNHALTLGIFPNSLKIAKVIPIYKGGCKSELTNYRPISILPVISKIFEKLIYKRTLSFLSKHSILIPSQYGFRSNHSTSHALIDAISKAHNNISHKEFTAFLMLDLKKAFDTVSHEILLKKLEYYGVRGITNNLFESYLSNRYQYVTISNEKSSKTSIKYGVPQGSMLGPLLFLLYINDIYTCTTNCPILFADDTCLLIQDSKLENLQVKITKEISTVTNWLNANKLTLNMSKSDIIVISPTSINTKSNVSTSYLQDLLPIKVVKETKYLGITIDNELTFHNHIKQLATKLSKSVGIICKVKPFLSTKTLLLLYHSLFQSHLLYGLILWGSTFKSYLKKLTSLQNKIVKIIGGGRWQERATPYYHKLKILKLQDLFQLELAQFMFKYKSNALPTNLSNLFQSVEKIHSKGTRSITNCNYFLTQCTSSRLQRSIKYQGVKLWNTLNPEIKQSSSLAIFKKKVKLSLIEKYK